VGFNVACARLGRKATIITKRDVDSHWTQVVVDINELKKKNNFSVKPYSLQRESKQKSGTLVIIQLSKEHDAAFSRSKYMEMISDKLGEAYSYILRSEVPGLTGEVAGAPRSLSIVINSKPVRPWIPCVWSELRSVSYKGVDVCAIQKFNRDLPEASVCEDCGHWHTRSITSNCEACGSANVKVTTRRVWGWVGVQRFMDRLDFGLNFIRNGRTILIKDQKIFTFHDDSTGESYKDYPVEWPADMGRIVGEVHCDHVRVDFIKRECFH
jgi:hypothetical protein